MKIILHSYLKKKIFGRVVIGTYAQIICIVQEIQKENETYYSLLREALPPGPARFGKVKHIIIVLTSKGGGFQPEPEAWVGRKNLGASSHCGRRHHLSQPGCKFDSKAIFCSNLSPENF